jgi:hypothetical protein
LFVVNNHDLAGFENTMKVENVSSLLDKNVRAEHWKAQDQDL